jgi:NTE family protein
MKNHFIRTVIILLLGNIIFLNAEEIGFQEKITLKYKDDKHYPLINFSYREPVSLKVALVLSGGGGRGLAHLGVLKALEEHKIPIHLIVGSSIGSAIGGFYAAGYNSEQLIRIFKEIDWADVYNDETNRINLFWSQKSTPRRHILELRLDNGIPYIPTSLSPGQKIFDIIYSRLIKANFQAANDFDNLRIPFRAVATDLISGKRIVLKSGDLAEAISGSMAFPLLFAPVEMNGMMLVDGGIKDNLPVDVAVNQGAHITLAVDVTSSLRKQNQINSPWQIADQVTTIMMQEPTQRSREMADILILPQVGDRGVTDFKHIDSLVDLGYKATLSKIDSIQQLLENRIQDLWGENKYLGKVSKVKFYGWYNN